jgi:hypothetical protein
MILFGYIAVFADDVRDDEEDAPNVKRMRVREEEISLSQPITAAVPPEEEEVPVSQGLAVAVLPEEEDVLVPFQGPPVTVPSEEEVPQGPLSRSLRRKKSSWKNRRSQSRRPPCRGPVGTKGCLVMVNDKCPNDECPILPLVSSSPSFFSQKRRRFFSPFFLLNVVDL